MKDFNALQVFLALMQTHSTQRAALKLGRSQSYVSKILSQLREELEDPLFVRSPEGLTPTSYSMSIEPKLRSAFEMVQVALHPEVFDPKDLDKVTLHIIEPYLVVAGRSIIRAIRQETDAIIEMRVWNRLSEAMIDDGQVDMGLHMLNEKPQTFYQKKLHSGAGFFDGNTDGEYVKFLLPGINDHINHFQVLDPSIEATVFVDNYQLMNQLLDDCYTVRYAPFKKQSDLTALNVDTALIMQSSKRHSPKMKWLVSLIEPIVQQYAEDWVKEIDLKGLN